MASRTVGFAVSAEDAPLLERLVQHFGGGNRSEFLRAAIRTMAAAERAERLGAIQAAARTSVGRGYSQDEVDELVREVIRSSRA